MGPDGYAYANKAVRCWTAGATDKGCPASWSNWGSLAWATWLLSCLAGEFRFPAPSPPDDIPFLLYFPFLFFLVLGLGNGSAIFLFIFVEGRVGGRLLNSVVGV